MWTWCGLFVCFFFLSSSSLSRTVCTCHVHLYPSISKCCQLMNKVSELVGHRKRWFWLQTLCVEMLRCALNHWLLSTQFFWLYFYECVIFFFWRGLIWFIILFDCPCTRSENIFPSIAQCGNAALTFSSKEYAIKIKKYIIGHLFGSNWFNFQFQPHYIIHLLVLWKWFSAEKTLR